MENVKWINGSYKEDNRIFDSEIQAEEWVDALYPDFVPYLFNKINVGYATPDEKVFKYLVNYLPEWARYNNVNVSIYTEKITKDGQVIFKIWTQ
ncbi:hypothetical protein NST21_17480 [Peribacillus sp. FSL K6-1552]|uniref:hypothetical protein n=1 Tax=Peribacillus sp. FSL K6-1552 TaxID=2954514 RepID=UPI0030F54C2C